MGNMDLDKHRKRKIKDKKKGIMNDYWKLQKEKSETLSSSLLKTYGYNFDKEDCFDSVDFINHFGIEVGIATRLDINVDGFTLVKSSNMHSNTIGVNDERSAEQKRYIIVYEFARFILKYEIGTVYFHKKIKDSAEEKEVKYLAAALLMPKKPFLRRCSQLQKSCINDAALCLQLAAIFKVPMDCVAYRLREMELPTSEGGDFDDR